MLAGAESIPMPPAATAPRRGDRGARSPPTGVPGDGAIRAGRGEPPDLQMREGAKPLPPEVGQPGKEAPPTAHTGRGE